VITNEEDKKRYLALIPFINEKIILRVYQEVALLFMDPRGQDQDPD
jgi:hypothetical protein